MSNLDGRKRRSRAALNLLLLLLLLLPATPAAACFGPKLYVGVADGTAAEALYALTALYLKEKTGVETVKVAAQGPDLLGELAAERLDLAVVAAGPATASALIGGEGLPQLHAGRRPREDLQFTTVLPALHKLATLLGREQLLGLAAAVADGAAPVAAARRLLNAEGWL